MAAGAASRTLECANLGEPSDLFDPLVTQMSDIFTQPAHIGTPSHAMGERAKRTFLDFALHNFCASAESHRISRSAPWCVGYWCPCAVCVT